MLGSAPAMSTTAEPSPPRKASNLAIRLLTAAAWVPVLLGLLFYAPPWAFALLVAFASAVSGFELVGMTIPKEPVLRVAGVLMATVASVSIMFLPVGPVLGTLLVASPMVALLLALARPGPIEGAAVRAAWLALTPLYGGALVGTVGALRMQDSGASWVVLAMLLAWFGDTGAYFAGRALGRHKLYELVSPNKTIEGSIGGLLGSTLGAVLASTWFLRELPIEHAIPLALLAGTLGQAGDLAESLIKRTAGVKDSGVIIPGHGGMLDRIDALVMTGATVWLYLTWFAPGAR